MTIYVHRVKKMVILGDLRPLSLTFKGKLKGVDCRFSELYITYILKYICRTSQMCESMCQV